MSDYNMNPAAGGIKHDGDKTRLELLPFEALEEVGKVLTVGAIKYAPDNWRKGMSWRRVLGSALRHLFAWGAGEDKDPETELSHLAHAACCVLFLLSYSKTGAGTDDRPGAITPTGPEDAPIGAPLSVLAQMPLNPATRAVGVSSGWWASRGWGDDWARYMEGLDDSGRRVWFMYCPATSLLWAFATKAEAEAAHDGGMLGLWAREYSSTEEALRDPNLDLSAGDERPL